MIRVLMLDLDGTLADQNGVFPHVCEALEALLCFETANGQPLAWCLVSDFQMPAPPSSRNKIETLFRDFTARLKRLGLTEFFRPVTRRITLSTHAGALKPDRRLFETAVRRLGLEAGLDECLFITGLEASRQIAHEPGPLPPGATHHVKTNAKGKKRLTRKRFSAI